MSSGSMSIITAQNKNLQTIVLTGEIDFAASLDIDPLLAKAVSECNDELLLDLENVTFIDSEGIKMLLHAFGELAEKKKRARIVKCSPRIRRVFKLAGVETLLNVVPELSDKKIRKTTIKRVQPLYWHK